MNLTKILVITNNINISQDIRQALNQAEISVLVAADEQQGIKLIDSQLPDLIICELDTEDFDSGRILIHLKQNIHTAIIPVIALMKVAEPQQWRRAMDLGADDVLFFPFSAAELRNAIAARLSKTTAYLTYSQQKLENLCHSFINFLPHEMRTALTGILAASDLLVNQLGSLDFSVVREISTCIHASSQRLSRLINNLLLYSELKLIDQNPNKLQLYLNERTESVQGAIAATAQEFTQKYSRQADLILKVEDAVLPISLSNFTKVVEELVDNACKFSPAGTAIQITSKVNQQQYILTISNHGRGMTPTQISAISMGLQFERETYEQQGFGLGLAIAKELTQLHQGKLLIDSIPNQIISVSVILPLAQSVPFSSNQFSATPKLKLMPQVFG